MTRPAPIDDVPAGVDVIRLGQFLQLAGLVDTGGEAKAAIREGEVTVNGEVDLRRGRQLVVGDVVSFAGRQARVSD
ncbi:RNA-binding S4 domain-containing protein [uncultured Demequina sp.]|uniref:RNA-binding S4 domain-containing protein n=1 Tax=uncultured Demequina sp. TaxID=693499 RepID=UPI0025E3A988|nr:RNA-binding S4 domain-containing protein [uncultured Demequina sp.]